MQPTYLIVPVAEHGCMYATGNISQSVIRKLRVNLSIRESLCYHVLPNTNYLHNKIEAIKFRISTRDILTLYISYLEFFIG